MASIGRYVATTLVAGGVLLGPLAFGATEVWSLCALQILAVMATGAWLLTGATSRRGLWLPLVVAAVGFLQVSPLPKAVLRALAPPSGEAYGALEAYSVKPPAACVSLSPGATRQAARQAFLLALLAVVTYGVAQGRRERRWIAWTTVVAGGLVLLIGYVPLPRNGPLLGFHDMRGPPGAVYKNSLLPLMHSAAFGYPAQVQVGRVSYEVDEWYVGDTFGPYVVSNHFAGCMDLTIPLGAALLCGAADRLRRGHVARVVVPCGWAFLALLAVSTGARSDAGTASLLAGLLCVAWQMARPGWFRTALGIALAGFLAAWLALFAALCSGAVAGAATHSWLPRTARDVLRNLEMSAQGRVQAYQVAAEVFCRSPLFGTGLGTYADLYPRRADQRAILGFAHNDYLQLAAESGLAGCAVAAAALAWAVALHRRRRTVNAGWPEAKSGGSPSLTPAGSDNGARDRHTRPGGGALWHGTGRARVVAAWGNPDSQLAAGLLGSLLAFSAHSAFDWNLHVPANAWIFATLAGLWLATTSDSSPVAAPQAPSAGRGLPRWAAYGATIALLILATDAILRQRVADKWAYPLRCAVVAQGDGKLAEAVKQGLIVDALPAALGAARIEPWNADWAETIARAYLHLSHGRNSAELSLARQWFRRTLALCPARQRVATTLRQIGNEDLGAGR